MVDLGGVKVQSEKTQLSSDAVFLAEEDDHVSRGAKGTVSGDVPQMCTVTGVCGHGTLTVMGCLSHVPTPTSNTASGCQLARSLSIADHYSRRPQRSTDKVKGGESPTVAAKVENIKMQ